VKNWRYRRAASDSRINSLKTISCCASTRVFSGSTERSAQQSTRETVDTPWYRKIILTALNKSKSNDCQPGCCDTSNCKKKCPWGFKKNTPLRKCLKMMRITHTLRMHKYWTIVPRHRQPRLRYHVCKRWGAPFHRAVHSLVVSLRETWLLGPVSPRMYASPQTLWTVVTHSRVSNKIGQQRPGTVCWVVRD